MKNELNFTRENKKGRKAKLYMVLDCETATLPFIKQLGDLSPKDKQKIAIAKPLIYDIGWKVVDAKGNVYSQHSFLIQETFFVPNIFNTAYYASKRPLYMERYRNKEIIVKTWEEAMEVLEHDLQYVEFALAYNAMFDFKKAIPFTEDYINNLYYGDYNMWENKQKRICKSILSSAKWENPEEFDGDHFNFRGNDYPIADLWGLSCQRLINKEKYKDACLEHGMISPSGLYFKTSAETTFRFLIEGYDFVEEHTALADVEIETEILKKILKKGKLEQGITYFPFQELGDVVEYIRADKNKKRMKKDKVQNVINIMENKLSDYDRMSSFSGTLENKMLQLINFNETNNNYYNDHLKKDCQLSLLKKAIKKQKKYRDSLKPGGDAYYRAHKRVQDMIAEYKELEQA